MALFETAASLNEVACADIRLYTLPIARPSGVIIVEISFPGIGFLVPGKKSCFCPAKFPASLAELGTVTRDGCAFWRSRFHSSPTKKNSLSFLMGPPRL